jgi:hypothetical protein
MHRVRITHSISLLNIKGKNHDPILFLPIVILGLAIWGKGCVAKKTELTVQAMRSATVCNYASIPGNKTEVQQCRDNT